MMSCDHNNDIRTRLISHVISDYCISKQKINIEMMEFVKFTSFDNLHVTSLYCDHMILYAVGHVLLVTIILASKI